jgi:predicted DNA-binding transcriptional regulator AlpA
MTTNPNHRDAATASAATFEPFISKPEVARRLGKRVRTIDNWMQLRLLPYYKIGRSVAFKWSEVKVQLKQVCRVGPVEDE